MKKKRQLIAFFTLLALFICMLPNTVVKASDDVDIISSTSVTAEQAKKWAKSKGATDTFVNLADLYWKYSSQHGNVNPALAYVQSAKETGYGKFGGVIDESFHNPCGMKIKEGGGDYDKEAHQRFATWDEGVQAHLDHLALYAGAAGYPRNSTPDPRHFPYLAGKAKTAVSLTGNWTGGTYGEDLVKLYNDLSKYSGSSVTPSPSPSLPNLVTIDSPYGTQSVSGNWLTVNGWALTTSGIKQVNVYVDGKLKNGTTNFIERKDVVQAYPGYTKTIKPGFSSKVDISDITSGGIKKIVVEVVANDGAVVKAESSFKLERLPNLVTIDSPWGTQSVSGDWLTVNGWALTTSGIKQVNVYVDGKLKNGTTNFIERKDVVQVYPGYTKTTKPGFSSRVNISDIKTGGIKKIVVEVIANDGAVVKAESSFKLAKLENLVTIDSPWGTQSVSGDWLTVTGWALASSEVKNVSVYVDGKLKNGTTEFYERDDVKKAYPAYTTAKPGFTSKVNISDIATAGTKRIVVKVEAKDGTVAEASSTFNLKKPEKLESMVTIDSPWGSQQVTNNKLVVNGWALSSSGVKTVNVYVDGALKNSTTTFSSRSDVLNAYPQYKNGSNDKPGFTSTVDLNDIESDGMKKLEVEVIDNDGSKKRASSTFKLERLGTLICIDSPQFYGNNSNSITVTGWALSCDEIQEVKVFVDGKFKNSTKSLYARKDVNEAFPAYNKASKPGFSVNIDMSKESAGSKTLAVELTAKDGGVYEYEQPFRFKTKDTIGFIESPNTTDTYNETTLNVSGWIASDVEVSRINVYVDEVLRGTTLSKVKRDDVVKVHPGYASGVNCGYSLNISTEALSVGQHVLTVQGISVDGEIFEQAIIFNFKSSGKLIVVDPGHNNGGDDGAYSNINGVNYSERVLNDEIAIKLKAKLEAKGYRVLFTREPFTANYASLNESLANRVSIANSLGAIGYISIHQNAYSSESAHGTEVFYTTKTQDSGFPSQDRENKLNKSKAAASSIVSKIASYTGIYNRGSKDGNLFVLRNTTMPAVLVECGFITNPGDVSKLSDSSYQDKIAAAIADGVVGIF